jgi:hypothetical protein
MVFLHPNTSLLGYYGGGGESGGSDCHITLYRRRIHPFWKCVRTDFKMKLSYDRNEGKKRVRSLSDLIHENGVG